MPKVKKKQIKKIRKGDDPWSEAVRRAGRYNQKQQKELKEIGLLGDGMTSAEMLCHFEHHINCFAAEVDENSKVKVKEALDIVLQHCALSDRHRASWACKTFRQGLSVCCFVCLFNVVLFACVFVCLFVLFQAL